MKETKIPNFSRTPADLLRVLTRGTALASRGELAQWLQHDVQPWIPHQLMLWAEMRDGIEECALVSAPATMGQMECAGWGPKLMAYFADCWIAAQHTPTRVALAGCEALLGPHIEALPQRDVRSALVHGVVDRFAGTRHVFAALGPLPVEPEAAPSALKLFISVLDTAVRATPLAAPEAAADRPLSERERQIMHWIARGKTNPEIGCILRISEFTVKNHVKSIFSKLDVSNRAQAVAKLNRVHSHV
jgi:transcriptional regulator EpsA